MHTKMAAVPMCIDDSHHFSDLIDDDFLPCLSVLAFKKGNVVCDFTGGSAPGKTGRFFIDRTTRFNIGSVTKPITGSLLVKLAEMNELAVDDVVRKFIPEYRFADITILDLLTHTAGYDGAAKIAWPDNAGAKRSYLDQIYAIDRLQYPRGGNSSYFSFGYSIILDIIERVTMMAIEDFARKVLFDPLEMSATTYDVAGLKKGEYVLPYNRAERNSCVEACKNPATGDSGLYANAADLIKFGQMLLNNGTHCSRKIFAESSIDYMFREVTGNRFMRTPVFWLKGTRDVHGCFGDRCSESTVGHPGFTGCMLFIDRQNETAGVILSNSMALHEDWGNYKRLCDMIMASSEMEGARRPLRPSKEGHAI
jgi:serine-type D-Ala-D-Ala carboxypeptidase